MAALRLLARNAEGSEEGMIVAIKEVHRVQIVPPPAAAAQI